MSSVPIAHEWLPPTVTVLNVPDGASVCAYLAPQQVIVSSVWIAHELLLPTATVLNVPDGASVCPWALWPQQVMVSSVRKPHE